MIILQVPPVPPEIAIPLAVIVAFSAFAAFIINLYNLVRDRPRFRLIVDWSGREAVEDPGQHYIRFYIYNHGTRPGGLHEFGFLTRGLLRRRVPLSEDQEDFRITIESGHHAEFLLVPESTRGFDQYNRHFRSPPKTAYILSATRHRIIRDIPQDIRDALHGHTGYRPWWKFWEQAWWPW